MPPQKLFTCGAGAQRHPARLQRIRALEEWLGVVLFDRTALPVRLTAQGEQFLPVARDIVDRMAEARREFAAGNRSDGIVRLISLPTLSINVLPDLLFRVRQTCDQLRFVVNPFPQSVEEHFCALMEHQVDMLLTYRLDEYESDSEFLSHIESATVGRERFLPVVGSALAERLPSASPLPYLSYRNFSFANRIILPLYEKTPCELQSVYESSLSEGIVKMLEKGIGMAWVPETLVSEQLKRVPSAAYGKTARISGSGHQALSQQNRPPRRHRNLLESDPPVSIHHNARHNTIKKPGPS